MTDYNRIIKEIEERKKQSSIQSDMVNNPPHYNQAGIECLDAIRAATNEGYEYYLQGNILKYLWRYRYKNGVEDLNKAQFYLQRLIEEVE
jgi:hypothetical protein